MSIIGDDTGTRIARRLRLERDARGWSLAELAERSGVSKATISKIEREELSPTAVILVRLASAFDLTLAGLLVRAEGDGEQTAGIARGRPAGVARSRHGLFPPAGVRPARPSRRDHPGRNARRKERGPAGLVLCADPPGGLGAIRRTRHHREWRAQRAGHRRLPRIRSARRNHLRQREQGAPAPISSLSLGARAMHGTKAASAQPDISRGTERARPVTMAGRRWSRSTGRNGATAGSETIFTGRRRIARRGAAPRPAS